MICGELALFQDDVKVFKRVETYCDISKIDINDQKGTTKKLRGRVMNDSRVVIKFRRHWRESMHCWE